MNKKIYIFGHQNPDTDSICSTIAYTNLKRTLGLKQAVACRLGDINNETKFALEYFGQPAPQLIKSVQPQVSDLNLRSVVTAREDSSVKKVLEMITKQVGRSIPVVDENKKMIGIISISDIAPAYTGKYGKSVLKETKTPLKNVIEVLDVQYKSGEYSSDFIQGDMYSISELYGKNETLSFSDILITVFNKEAVMKAFNSGAGCIIIADYEAGSKVSVPDSFKGLVLCSLYSVFEVVRLVTQTIPISSMIKKDRLEYFVMYETIEDVSENMATSKYRRFPVVDENGYIQGMISRSNLFNMNRKKVILIDHNEKSQSIKGLEEAEIIEIIDHHRVADVQTVTPLYYRAEPVGCTSTIIAKMYEEYGVEIDNKIAGLMLSAILSDTLLFNSPTCTYKDKEAAEYLAVIAGVDIEKYGMDMISAGSTVGNETPEKLITMDMKRFTFGKYRVMISQINTGDFDSVFSMYNEIYSKMDEKCKMENLDLAVLMITDIVVGGSEIILTGKEKWIGQRAFNIENDEDTIFLNKVFSRKKQVVPALMNAARL